MNKYDIFTQQYFLNRYTHSEKRYHSEVRQEAVQQALAAINQGKQSNNALGVPMPSKRSSVMQQSSQNDKVSWLCFRSDNLDPL